VPHGRTGQSLHPRGSVRPVPAGGDGVRAGPEDVGDPGRCLPRAVHHRGCLVVRLAATRRAVPVPDPAWVAAASCGMASLARVVALVDVAASTGGLDVLALVDRHAVLHSAARRAWHSRRLAQQPPRPVVVERDQLVAGDGTAAQCPMSLPSCASTLILPFRGPRRRPLRWSGVTRPTTRPVPDRCRPVPSRRLGRGGRG